MKHTFLLLILWAFAAVSHSQDSDFLMRDFGSFRFSGDGYSVRIDLVAVENGGLIPTLTFDGPGKSGSVGASKSSPIPVKAHQWAAEFHPPHELWIYDGEIRLKLYKRTSKGFKASSSGVVPALFSRAPEKLKKVIAENDITPTAKSD